MLNPCIFSYRFAIQFLFAVLRGLLDLLTSFELYDTRLLVFGLISFFLLKDISDSFLEPVTIANSPPRKGWSLLKPKTGKSGFQIIQSELPHL